MGHMARGNPQMMRGLAGRSTLKAMMDRGESDGSGTKALSGAAAADSGSLPGGGGGFAGMPGYHGMPGGPRPGPGGVGGRDNRGPDASPENYREFFAKMRNFFPPGPMGGPAQGNSPEEFQRMMIARAMGQGGGMHGNGERETCIRHALFRDHNDNTLTSDIHVVHVWDLQAWLA